MVSVVYEGFSWNVAPVRTAWRDWTRARLVAWTLGPLALVAFLPALIPTDPGSVVAQAFIWLVWLALVPGLVLMLVDHRRLRKAVWADASRTPSKAPSTRTWALFGAVLFLMAAPLCLFYAYLRPALGSPAARPTRARRQAVAFVAIIAAWYALMSVTLMAGFDPAWAV